MKHLNLIGVALVAALSLMASVGAGTASASTALSTDSAGAVKYAAGTSFTWTPGIVIIIWRNTSGSAIAECTSSTLGGKTSNETGTSVEGSIETLEFGGCSQTTDVLAKGSLKVTKSGTDKATVSGAGTKITFGIFGVSCVYGTGEGTTLGTVTGGEAPVTELNATLAKIEGGFLCPSTIIWIFPAWIWTSPHAVHFVE